MLGTRHVADEVSEVAMKIKVYWEFLWRRRDPTACFCHHLAPELEIVMDENITEQIDTMPYLPNELMIKIFIRVPAEVLHRSVRFVCKRWAYIVRDPLFIEAHLRQSNPGLFIEGLFSASSRSFLHIKGGKLIVTHVSHQLPGSMNSSCDGVALFNDLNEVRALYVANPVTMEVVKLPYLDSPPMPLCHSSCIARVHSTGEYKVVHLYQNTSLEYDWVVLTVGIDNWWRKTSCQPTYDAEEMDLYSLPISVGGIIYWSNSYFERDGMTYFLVMDVDDETMHSVPIPSESRESCAYMRMGDCLCGFITALPSSSHFEICVLKDWRRGEWAKLYRVDKEISRGFSQDVFLYQPLGWLNNEVFIVMAETWRGDMILIYYPEENKIRIMHVFIGVHGFNVFAHTNSLVSWVTH